MRRIGILTLACLGAIAVPAVAAASVVFDDANMQHVVKPKTLFLTGDGTLEVQSATWSSWGGSTAGGSGKAEYHGCTPSCAGATAHHAHVTIKLSKIKTCSGKQYYSHVALTLPSGNLLDTTLLKRSWAPC